MQDGDLVAIIRTGAGIGALQQFTSDKHLLLAAIEKITWNPRGRGGVSTFAPISVANGTLRGSTATSIDDNKEADGLNDLSKLDEFRNESFTAGTLGAVNYVVSGMRELPGRKSIMLLSDGFPLFSQAGNTKNSSIILQRLRKLVDAANRASVVINTMDARGLQPLGLTAADDVGSRPLSNGKVITLDKIARATQGRAGDFYDSQDGLVFLARETGGFAVFNDNDLNGGIRRMLNEQSYYLIGYQPDSDTFDAEKDRFNKFEVKVKRDDVKVRYRSGFFGITDEDFKKPKQNLTAEQTILEAIYSPFAVNGISLRLNTLFSNSEKEGSFVRSLLHVDTKDLTFKDEGNGKKRLTFDVFAANFDTKGVPLDEISKTYDLTVSGEKYERIAKDGFVYFFSFPVKKEGAYQMRVVIRDHASGKIGSANQFIEIPKLKKNRPLLSDLILENLTAEQWNRESQNNQINVTANQSEQVASDPMRDTSLRVFKRGTVLRYAYELYNPKFDAGQKPQLSMRTRLFYDGKVIYEGNPQPIDVSGQTDLSRVQAIGALNLSGEMKLGE